MSGYPHPAQGYYGDPAPPPAPASAPVPAQFPANSYDMPPRGGGAGVPMPRPPAQSSTRGFLGRHLGLAISMLLWVAFLLIDVLVHGFPHYPYSNHPHPHGRTLITVVYTFVFQVIWFLGVGTKTAWDLCKDLMRWWHRAPRGPLDTLALAIGLLVAIILPVWPLVALAFNASVQARANRRG